MNESGNENANENESDENESKYESKNESEIESKNESDKNEVDNQQADEIMYDPKEEELKLERAMSANYGSRTEDHNLRPRRPRDYSHNHTTLESIATTQHSMKKGIKEFGDDGVEAVLMELKQLHDRKVLEPKDAAKLSREAKRASLRYLMLLKKKRCGRIKARGYADGRGQRSYIAKEDASAPTVAIESVMLPQ
jgi:hypothetical protein